jgi:hypothetical protein
MSNTYGFEPHHTRLGYSHSDGNNNTGTSTLHLSYLTNETTEASAVSPNDSEPNMILTGIMMGFVAIFTISLCYLILPSMMQCLRRKIPVTTAQIQRRYQTIEGWLITKVNQSLRVCKLAELLRKLVDLLVFSKC